MKRLVIIAHDPPPNTRRLTGAAVRRATDASIDGAGAGHVRPLDAGADDVIGSDAVILGTPENLGYMSGALKGFVDRCFHDLDGRSDALPYAFFVRAGRDGTVC